MGSMDFCGPLGPSKYFTGGVAARQEKKNETSLFTYIPEILNVVNYDILYSIFHCE